MEKNVFEGLLVRVDVHCTAFLLPKVPYSQCNPCVACLTLLFFTFVKVDGLPYRSSHSPSIATFHTTQSWFSVSVSVSDPRYSMG